MKNPILALIAFAFFGALDFLRSSVGQTAIQANAKEPKAPKPDSEKEDSEKEDSEKEDSKTDETKADSEKEDAQAEGPSGSELADAADSFTKRYAKEISARRRAGLSEGQAIEVQKAQVREDERQAKLAKESKTSK